MRFWRWRSVVVATVITVYLFAQSGDAGAPSVAASPPLAATDLSWMVPATTSTTVQMAPSTTLVSVPSLPWVHEPVVDGAVWDRLAGCETGGNWSAATGNGFGGGLQFAHTSSYSSWNSYGGLEFAVHPWLASREQQIVVAERILVDVGWRAWPACSRKFGWL